ncbi:hypothetical protein [Kitasatospora sp. NPDC097643]|uniref:hypothetical protein n=1 Tax=Kitasatospora sp. NPDC097643 TaxID=3157230 RepID=UPI00331CE28E
MKATKTTKTLRNAAMAVAAGVLAMAGTLTGVGSAHADAATTSIPEPSVLFRGGHLDAGDTRLILQDDGNLVLYRAFQDASLVHPVWSAPGTYGCGYKAIVQGDGNFVVYDVNSRPCWSTNTFKSNPNQTTWLTVSALGGFSVEFTDNSGWRPRITIRSSDLY